MSSPQAVVEERILTHDIGSGRYRDLSAHLSEHGPVPLTAGRSLIGQVEQAGLTGRGGAGFPVARKLAAVAAGTAPVVVANGAEGEPASSKDRILLSYAPHLVLDGLQLACRAVGATVAYVYVHEGPLVSQIETVVRARARAGVDAVVPTVVSAPARFVSGQETAVVSRINGGRALPIAVPPPVYVKGVDRRPTLVQNVETLAHLALIARHGASWFGSQGTDTEPGTMLCTVGGAVASPGVIEVPIGTSIDQVIDRAGGPSDRLGAVLVGGYHGAWLPAADAAALPLSVAGLRPVGATPGAGVLIALKADSCGLVETARAVGYLAHESARQCGPCLNGLPAMAQTLAQLAAARPARGLPERIEALSALVEKRGACHHPDGTVRLVRSALRVFAGEVVAHQAGRCTATDPRPVLAVPAPTAGRS
jgi:NADH:ubiquinone oxidoreductase subunit F (NADH-binding)